MVLNLPCSTRGRRTTGARATGGGASDDRRDDRRRSAGRPEGRPEEERRATGGGAPGERRDDRRISWAPAASGEATAASGWAAAAVRGKRSRPCEPARGKRSRPNEPYPVRSLPPSIILRKKSGGLNGLDRAEPGSARAPCGPALLTRLGLYC
jgi:hypothetical protein